MDIHLSWSPIQVVMTCLPLYAMLFAVWYNAKTEQVRKQVKIAAGVFVVLILFSAFDVGTRQSDLGRSSFNTDAPQVIEVPQPKRYSTLSAEEAYEEVLKSKKEQ